eukprot:2137641-Pyramimonas_sp.AAC.1
MAPLSQHRPCEARSRRDAVSGDAKYKQRPSLRHRTKGRCAIEFVALDARKHSETPPPAL